VDPVSAKEMGRAAARRDAERRFPHKVDTPMTADESEIRVRGMVAWCWQRAEPGAWEQHGHDGLRRSDSRPLPTVVRFYFMDAGVAEAFKGRWVPAALAGSAG
jgi:hypothetical protein